jgi:DNA-binding CsgD family transcriptional regulator
MDPNRRWEAMLRVIRGVSRVEELDAFAPTVLEEIDALIPSDAASFNEVDPLAGRASVVGRPYGPTADQLVEWQRWAHQNPSLMHILRTGDGSARRISDFMTHDELHALELYTHVYAALGIEYQLSVALPAPQPTVLGIALNRGDADFSDEEVALLDALRPHLVQSYRSAQLLTEHRRALDGVTDALEDDGRAFFVAGEVASDPAAALLARHYASNGAALPGEVQAWLEREQASFAAGEPNRLGQPLVSSRDGRRLTIRFVPGGRGPDLVWLVERVSEPDARPLQRLGLSPRQAQVLWGLTKGQSTSQIAAALGISVGTTKKHLEHVYRKLGVASATAAIAQAFDALATDE